jgi:hypothetical protein
MHYNGCMSSSPHQFGPHAAHLPAAPIQRRAHTRRPHLNLAEYDARVKGEDELRAALVKLQAAKAKLEVDPENADFQKAVRLVEIDVQSTTQMARLLKSPNVDAILAEFASKPVPAAAPVPASAVTTGSDEQKATGSQGTGQGGPSDKDVNVQLTTKLALLVEMAPKAALKKALQAIATKDAPDTVKLAEMRKLLAEAGINV